MIQRVTMASSRPRYVLPTGQDIGSGALGIGIELDASISTLAWTRVSLILIVIFATVIVSEWVSARVRHASI